MKIVYDGNFITVDDVILSYTHNSDCVNVPAKVNGASITRIGTGAFMGIHKMRDITVQNGIRQMGSRAFAGCEALRNVVLPESLVEMETDAFGDTHLDKISFWLRIPYNKYVTVREGSIRLTDGRYIIDPKALGEKNDELIRSFMPKAVPNIFPVDRRMGYLYTRPITYPDPQILAFADYFEENHLNVDDILEKDMRYRILNGYEISLTGEDMTNRKFSDERSMVALLICEKEGSICDSDISLQLSLARDTYFFKNLKKVNWHGDSYYFEFSCCLTGDDGHPYDRIGLLSILDSKGNPMRRLDIMRAVTDKYMLFC